MVTITGVHAVRLCCILQGAGCLFQREHVGLRNGSHGFESCCEQFHTTVLNSSVSSFLVLVVLHNLFLNNDETTVEWRFMFVLVSLSLSNFGKTGDYEA